MQSSQIKYMVANWLKSMFGKGPDSVKVNVADNIIFMDIRGSLTILETNFIKSSPDQGEDMINKIRKQIFDASIPNFTAEIQHITKMGDLFIESYLFEINCHNDRMVMVTIFNKSLIQWGMELCEA